METVVEKKKNASKWWRVGVFSLPLIGVLWFVVSLVFWIITLTMETGVDLASLSTVKSTIYWVLGILTVVTLPLTIVSIVMLARRDSKLAGTSIRFGWMWAKKTIWTWVIVLLVGALGGIALTRRGSTYTMPDPVALAEVEALVAQGEMPELYNKLALKGVDSVVKPGKQGIYNARQVINSILRVLFMLCLTSAALSVVYGSVLKFKNFGDHLNAKTMVYYVLGYILYILGVLIGGVLLIVPGIIMAMRWKFFDIGILKEGLNPIQAVKHSGHLTKGHVWALISLTVMQSAIQVLGMLCVVVGLFWTIPTAYIADVKAYEILAKEDEKE